jgi:hypothetical protein
MEWYFQIPEDISEAVERINRIAATALAFRAEGPIPPSLELIQYLVEPKAAVLLAMLLESGSH